MRSFQNGELKSSWVNNEEFPLIINDGKMFLSPLIFTKLENAPFF